jgi:uncharacterized protein YjbI with pentapeptide repeats
MTMRAAVILSLLLVVIMSSGVRSASLSNQVPAEEIISLVRDGRPVYYEGVSVVGDLSLDGLAEKRIKSPFVMINSTVQNASFDGVSFQDYAIFWSSAFENVSFNGTGFARADFSDTYFGRCSFMGASFSRPVSFDGALFQKSVSFADSLFDKDASFIGVRFLGDADFNYSSFDYYTYFYEAQFLGNATFSDVNFAGTLDISSSNFTNIANFFQSEFGDAADFNDAFFCGKAQFGLCQFAGISSFGNATFAKEAGFNMVRFADAVDFTGAHFWDDALFGLVKFEDIASFQGASFDGELNFKGSQISSMILNDASFGNLCRIRLNDSDFARLKAHWSDIKGHMIYDAGAYLGLVDNYRRMGWSGDEDDCYYDYRRIVQAERGWGWMKLLDAVAWLSCGYGVRPGYAVLWSILTIILFGLVFWAGDGIRRSSRPFQGAEADPVPERAILRNALFFSTMVFLSQAPIDFLPLRRYRYCVILEGILGWLLLALFFVTLGRIMIR